MLCLFLVNDELISEIGKGLCILVGISKDDTDKDIEYMLVGTKFIKYAQDFNSSYAIIFYVIA